MGKVVVEFGEFLLLNFLKDDGDVGGFVGVVTGDELGGEGLAFASLHTSEGLFEAFNEITLTDAVGQTLGFGFLDFLTVDGGGEIEGDEVAFLGSAVYALEGSETLAEVTEALLGDFVGGATGIHGDLLAGEVRHGDFGAAVHLGGEFDEVGVIDLGDINFGSGEGLHVVFATCFFVAARHHVVDDLLEHCATADVVFDQLGGSVTLTEAGNVDLRRDSLVSLVEFFLELLEGNLNNQLHVGGGELLNSAFHGIVLLVYRGHVDGFKFWSG